ncbi:S8 family serine peptidase [Sphingobium sp. BYY-5]|uniref:subtilisin-like serine protease QhpE n=1 Tax=Sphingobium sp. BYY-5 TaxID=2926400 RepID=UPI001FA78CAF|nr:S8 family serine peptidase [Sphingobium sp. BYY-5]MCI4590015.1 S8 family serine peptidase [Sphingobium sp. BYY-5]
MPDPIRIAVIDSGVHPAHPHIDAARLLPGIAIAGDGSVNDMDSGDRLGHGTAVTAAIQDQAPDVLCLPIRVFHDALRTTARALVSAIDWAIEARVDLINLSLGSMNPAHRDLFAQAADRAQAAGVLIVAAHEAEGAPCYPGSLRQVLGVSLDWDCPRDHYEVRDGLFHASGHPRPIPGVPQRRNLQGVSFAVANMSGLLARGGRPEIARYLGQAIPNPITRSTIQKQPIAPTA